MATPIPSNVAPFTLGEVAQITGGMLHGEPSAQVVGVCTDSRVATADNLFVALRGERFDAHMFLPQLQDKVAAVVVEEEQDGVPSVVVSDTSKALRDLARHHRRRWGRHVVGVTGSAGKTTTKEMIAAALDGAGLQVAATHGNLNNLIGVPMTLLTLGEEHHVAVVEMGTNAPSEIATLAETAEPDVGVVTLVAAAHTEGLGGIDGVLQEKTDLLRALPADGIAIVNGNDLRLRAWAERPTVTYGSNSEVELVQWRPEGQLTYIRYQMDGVAVEARTKLFGEAAAMGLGAALAVARALGCEPNAAAHGVEDLEPVAGRMCPIDVGGVLLIDDTYNANPSSTMLALRTGRQIADSRGRFIAVLGDMKELGDLSEAGHKDVIELAAQLADKTLFVGEEMALAGVDVVTRDDVVAALSPLQAGDVVLIKGSRSMALEKVVDALQEVLK